MKHGQFLPLIKFTTTFTIINASCTHHLGQGGPKHAVTDPKLRLRVPGVEILIWLNCKAMAYEQFPRTVREEFWKTFGTYMSPVPSATGERIQWINYKTGVKAIRFTLDLNEDQASVSMLVADAELFARLRALQSLFTEIAGDDWAWEEMKVMATLKGFHIRRREDWPGVISFFKQKMLALDSFWTEVKDIFL